MKITQQAIFLVLALLFSIAANSQDLHEDLELLEELSEFTNEEDQFFIGSIYQFGHEELEIQQDYSKAIEWYKRSAEQGYEPAQFRLGVMYYRGEVAPQNYNEAAKWLRQSAKQGNRESQTMLGTMYFNGRGVSLNPIWAYVWLSLGAVAGDETARELRDLVATELSSELLSRAQSIAQQCFETNYQTCETP